MRNPNIVVLKILPNDSDKYLCYGFWVAAVPETKRYMDVFKALRYDTDKEFQGIIVTWQDLDDIDLNGLNSKQFYLQYWSP